MTQQASKKTTAQEIDDYCGYRGPKHPCNKEEWEVIRPIFLVAMSPLRDGSLSVFRKHCASFVRLCVFARKLGYELTFEMLFDTYVIESFAATQSRGQADVLSSLLKLARLHGFGTAKPALGYKHRDPKAPYSAGELEALLAHAASLSTEHRRYTLSLIVHLGAGAGVVRHDLTQVEAKHLHSHASGLFVWTEGGCRFVLESSREALLTLAKLRPQGPLMGDGQLEDKASRAAEWTKKRKGIPALTGDRLRASYLERLLVLTLPVFEALSSIALRDVGRMELYEQPLSTCSLKESNEEAH